MANLISVSSAPVAGLGDKEYCDLVGTVKVIRKILGESARAGSAGSWSILDLHAGASGAVGFFKFVQ